MVAMTAQATLPLACVLLRLEQLLLLQMLLGITSQANQGTDQPAARFISYLSWQSPVVAHSDLLPH